VVERSIRIRQVGGSMPPISNGQCSAGSGIDARTLHLFGGLAQVVERPICMCQFGNLLRRCDGVVNVTDSKSVPFGGAGSNPANVLRVLVAQSADRPLHTRKAQGSIPCEN
jgi:hypothetical protein